MNKFGYTEFLPNPKSNCYSKNNYLMCIPKIINSELSYILKTEGCTLSFIMCEEIDTTIDLKNTIVDEKTVWTGCCYETIYSVRHLHP
jgi:hypothetical protein